MRALSLVISLGLVTVLAGCPKDEELTRAEAAQALEESAVQSEAAALTSNAVEISTDFTLGQGVEQAANELRLFIQSQLPCAEITLARGSLSVTYGAKPGNCTYRGNTFSGRHQVTVAKNADNQVEVDHTWTDLSNGKVKVSGTAKVTWDFQARFRNVKHDTTWTRISDGKTGRGAGDKTQRPLAGGLVEGIQVDGRHTWSGTSGAWGLVEDGVQMRWVDPVPQAGSYTLTTPSDKSLELSFARVDADSIRVTVSSGERSFSFNVNKLGGVQDGD